MEATIHQLRHSRASQLVGDYSFDEHPPVDGLRPLQLQEA